MINYLAAKGEQRIELTDKVLHHIWRYRQHAAHSAEAGGLLFAELSDACIRVVAATGPSILDRRSRYSFESSAWAAKRTISRMHRRGMHYVGEWHTHPEPVPNPSGDDRHSIRSVFLESKHPFAGLLLVIGGTQTYPDGLFVAIANGDGLQRLQPTSDSEDFTPRHVFI